MVQHLSKINGDNLNNIRQEASRHFRNKKMEYLKDKIIKLTMNSKHRNTCTEEEMNFIVATNQGIT
jgi:hypothetical protein